MKRKVVSSLLLVIMAIGLPRLGVVQCAAPPIAELLPADSLAYAELPNMDVFYYVISEIAQAAIASLEEEQAVPEDIKTKARAVLEVFEEIKPLLPKSASLGVVSIDMRTGQPSLVLVSELSEGLVPFASTAGKLMALAPKAEVTRTEHGIEVDFGGLRPGPIGYAVKDNVLYATMGKGLLDRVLSGRPAESLSNTAHFKEVNAIIGENAIVSAYVNVDAVCKTLLPNLPPHARNVAELLGLNGIHAAGLSLRGDEEFVGFNLALQYTENAPGIPSLLSIPNTAPKGIAYLPEDYSYAARLSFGPPGDLMKKIQPTLDRAGIGPKVAQTLAEIKEKHAIDVEKILASLGGEITFGVKIPQTYEIPSVLVCIEAKDPEYIMQTLKDLLKRASMTFSETEVAGAKSIMVTLPMPVPVSPAIAAAQDMIVIGISKPVLEKALAAKSSGQNIASKPKFKAAMEGLPASSNIALEYIEAEPLGQLVVFGVNIAAARAPAEAKPLIAKAMQYLNNAVRGLGEAVEVAYRTPGGLAVQSRFPTSSVMQILKNGAAFGAKAVMIHIGRREEPPERPPEVTPPAPAEEAAPVVEPVPVEEAELEGKVFIGLGAYATSPLVDMHKTEGNSLPFNAGNQKIGGLPYQIAGGIVQLSGGNFEDAPAEVKGIEVKAKFKRLHILHGTGWGSGVAAGTQIGSYVIHYEDGVAVEIPLKYGVHLRDWWVQSDQSQEVPEGKVAWTGRNNLAAIRLYSLTWENPHPDKLVTAIDCCSAGTACAPFVVAMTGEI